MSGCTGGTQSSYPTCQGQYAPCNYAGHLNPIPRGCPVADIMQPEQCPALISVTTTNPYCDIELPITNPIEFLVNLPVILLWTVSIPARFMYCMLYTLTLSLGDLATLFIILINMFIDLFLNPVFSAMQGFLEGFNGDGYDPSQVINAVALNPSCLYTIPLLGGFYNAIDQFFYTLGYIIGFFFGLLVDLYDTLLLILCYIAYLGFRICVAVGISGLCLTGYTPCVYPFAFLQPIVSAFINCGCVLNVSPCITFGVQLGCNCPPCYQQCCPSTTNVSKSNYTSPTPSSETTTNTNTNNFYNQTQSETQQFQSEINPSETSELYSCYYNCYQECTSSPSQNCSQTCSETCATTCSQQCSYNCSQQCSQQCTYNVPNNCVPNAEGYEYCTNLISLLSSCYQNCCTSECIPECTSECYQNCTQQCYQQCYQTCTSSPNESCRNICLKECTNG